MGNPWLPQWLRLPQWLPKGAIASVILSGSVTVMPYWTSIASLDSSSDIEACDKKAGCIYSLFFPSRRPHYPALGLFKYHQVINDANISADNYSWLIDANKKSKSSVFVFPVCANYEKKDTASRCSALPPDYLKGDMPERTSFSIYKGSLILWATSRIAHDILLLLWCPFRRTISVSHFSTLCLWVACLSSVIVTWNALELIYHSTNASCGCFYRRGLLTSTSTIASSISLVFHFQAKVEDSFRAYIGGDYLITKKYHIAYHFTRKARLIDTGSALGVVGIGLPAFGGGSMSNVDDVDDVPESVLFSSILKKKPCGRNLLTWFVGMLWLILGLFWCLPAPLIILRVIQIGYKLFMVLTGIDMIPFEQIHTFSYILVPLSMIYFGTLAIGTATFMVPPMTNHYGIRRNVARLLSLISTIPSLSIIADPYVWANEDKHEECVARLKAAFIKCPEVANVERIRHFFKHLDDNTFDVENPKSAFSTILKEAFKEFQHHIWKTHKQGRLCHTVSSGKAFLLSDREFGDDEDTTADSSGEHKDYEPPQTPPCTHGVSPAPATRCLRPLPQGNRVICPVPSIMFPSEVTPPVSRQVPRQSSPVQRWVSPPVSPHFAQSSRHILSASSPAPAFRSPAVFLQSRTNLVSPRPPSYPPVSLAWAGGGHVGICL